MIIKGLVLSKKGGDLKCLESKQQWALFCVLSFVYSITNTKKQPRIYRPFKVCVVMLALHSQNHNVHHGRVLEQGGGEGGVSVLFFTEILISCTENTEKLILKYHICEHC